MRYHALAADYDGTLALRGRVDNPTLAGLERLLATGRKLLLVTGRELHELLEIFPQIHLFEWVVAENGALLYRPSTREEKLLTPPPLPEFVEKLRERGVAPMSVGRAIVATWHPHETTILETIRDLGLELQVIFNKDAVMVLPSGVNKASGLLAALDLLGLSPHEVIGVGDAENDHAFLSLCECSAAVDNALPAVKHTADLVLKKDHGEGVVELIDMLVEDDLKDAEPRLIRHHLRLGENEEGQDVLLPSYGPNVLIAGPSGSGKSTLATSYLERLTEHQYQFCIIDPEGDYDALEGAITLGTVQNGPSLDEILEVLSKPKENLVINLVGLPLADRPPFFLSLLPRLQEMRARTGRPHWILVDEAHHLLPASWEPGFQTFSPEMNRTLFITVHPEQVSPMILKSIGTLMAVGGEPKVPIGQFCQALGKKVPTLHLDRLAPGETALWFPDHPNQLLRVKIAPSTIERRRHVRKYIEGELPPDRSFYFRGPQGKLNLRAQNLLLFLQIGDGVDDATWLHHLHKGDYSNWLRERIKDDHLADEVKEIEQQGDLSPAKSRERVRQAIERYYTLPASAPLPMPGTDAAPTRNE